MENSPKKSKALIITIILIIILILVGFFLFKNRNVSTTSSGLINKIFAPLLPSNNSKKTTAQAGEDLNKSDRVCVVSSDSEGNPIVMKVDSSGTCSDKVLGTTDQIIKNGDFGEIVLDTSGGSNGFLNSFSMFINDLFGNGDITTPRGDITPGSESCPNGAVNYPECTSCLNGATNYPLCTIEINEEELPDLTAGVVKPTSTTIDTPTTISSIITNEGNFSTVVGFTTLFTIVKESNIIEGEEIDPGTPISKSPFKNLLVKIINIIPRISKVSAAINPNTNITPRPVPVPGTFNFTTITPELAVKTGSLATISFTFNYTGTYSIRACADKNSAEDQGTIGESNEENNCGPWTILTVTGSLPPLGELPQCSDNLDNDDDGLIDSLDPNCHLDGDLAKDYVATHDDEASSPTTLYQCNDTNDNDLDGKIDVLDRNCHLDGDLAKDYVATHDDEASSPTTPVEPGEENKCLLIEQNPLIFTDAEKARLAELLRKFYLIVPTLKTEDDISMIYKEIDNYNSLIESIDGLINQCYLETVSKSGVKNPQYTGPTTRYGNPWYKYTDRGSYIDGTTAIEGPYCSGSAEKGRDDCDQNTKFSCENYIKGGQSFVRGCAWNQGTDIKEYEKILNIW